MREFMDEWNKILLQKCYLWLEFEKGLQMGKKEQKIFEIIKIVLCASPIVQPYSLTKGATVTADASEKAIDRVFSQKEIPLIYVSKRLSQVEQNKFNI